MKRSTESRTLRIEKLEALELLAADFAMHHVASEGMWDAYADSSPRSPIHSHGADFPKRLQRLPQDSAWHAQLHEVRETVPPIPNVAARGTTKLVFVIATPTVDRDAPLVQPIVHLNPVPTISIVTLTTTTSQNGSLQLVEVPSASNRAAQLPSSAAVRMTSSTSEFTVNISGAVDSKPFSATSQRPGSDVKELPKGHAKRLEATAVIAVPAKNSALQLQDRASAKSAEASDRTSLEWQIDIDSIRQLQERIHQSLESFSIANYSVNTQRLSSLPDHGANHWSKKNALFGFIDIERIGTGDLNHTAAFADAAATPVNLSLDATLGSDWTVELIDNRIRNSADHLDFRDQILLAIAEEMSGETAGEAVEPLDLAWFSKLLAPAIGLAALVGIRSRKTEKPTTGKDVGRKAKRLKRG